MDSPAISTSGVEKMAEIDLFDSMVPFMYGGLLTILLGFLVGYSNIERRGRLGIGIMMGGFLVLSGALVIGTYSSPQNG